MAYFINCFLTRYIYIPLGGNRKGKIRTYLNTMIIFLISGIWHGANWTFILWGILHGILSVFERIFEKAEKKVIEPVRWFFTFLWINILWLLFSANSVSQWKVILTKIFTFQNTSISDELINVFKIQELNVVTNMFHLENMTSNIRGLWLLAFIIISYGICLLPENNYKKMSKLSLVTMI